MIRTCLTLLTALTVASAGVADAQAARSSKRAIEKAFNAHLERALHLKGAGEFDGAVEAFDAALAEIRSVSGSLYDKARARVLFHKAIALLELKRFAESAAVLQVVIQSPGLEALDRDVVMEKLGFVQSKAREANTPKAPSEAEVAAAPPTAVEGPRPHTHLSLSTASSHQRSATSTWAIVSVSAAGALAVGGAVFHALGADDWDQPEGLNIQTAQGLRDRGETRLNVAYALYGVAGAAAVSAFVLMLLDEPDHLETTPQPSLAPVRGGLVVNGVVRF